MQTDDIENLSGRVAELTAELDIKKEMKNRVSIGELSVVKRKPWRSTIKIVDDPQSPWKMPRQKFRRQALDYTILGIIQLYMLDLLMNFVAPDHIGVIGANSDGSKEVDTRTARRSRVLSVGSRDSLRLREGSQIINHNSISSGLVPSLSSRGMKVALDLVP